jgi:MFS transporter, DHA1 family, multidrug resistance protein
MLAAMNPDSQRLWTAPRWALAVLLATLGMLGPFAVDTYLPAFPGIAASTGATPVQMQQTLSAYLFGFAFMNLFHGALADSFGRRPVVLWGIAVFTLASVGCALSEGIGTLVFFRALQGLSTGAGIVVSRAIIRDMFPPAEAQRMMSQVTIYFGVAPALALLPETLDPSQRQPFNVRHLMRGYREMVSSLRFLLLCFASGVPFNGMFLYVLSSPTFLGEHLGLAPTEFFWFFVVTICGIVCGAWVSGRAAGRLSGRRQIRIGLAIMLLVSLANVWANIRYPAVFPWAIAPIGIFAFGWALMVPVVTLMVLDLFPERRGMASSLQAVIGSVANGIVAGVVAPAVMHSTVWLAIGSLAMTCIGLAAWVLLRLRWPEVGRMQREPLAP